MAKKRKSKDKGIKESAVKHIVRTPLFKMRVEKDKTKYNRKGKHKGKSFDYNLKHIWNSIFNVVIKERYNNMQRLFLAFTGHRPIVL